MTQKFLAALFVGILSLTILAGTGNATLLLYEPFDYVGTDIATGSGGVWTDNVSVTSPAINQATGVNGSVTLSGDNTSLTFPGMDSVGGRVEDTDGGRASRGLGTGVSIDITSDNDYYVSMLIRGTAILQFYYGPHTDGAYYARTHMGITNTGEFYIGSFPGLKEDRSATYPNGTYDPNETYLLVAKIDASASSDDVFSMMIYDDTMTPDLTEPSSYDLVAANGSTVDMSYMLIGMSDDGAVDEIRIGTTWADVVAVSNVPEPSSIILLLTAALGVFAMRRSH